MSNSRDPIINAYFRIEIDGLPRTGATEVLFPEARIVTRGRTRRIVEYGTLTLRRGMTQSSEWYEWWDSARKSAAAGKRNVSVVLMSTQRVDLTRWMFSGAVPSGYLVSPLNALGREALIETLELSVGDLSMAFGSAGSLTAVPEKTAASRSRTRPRARRR